MPSNVPPSAAEKRIVFVLPHYGIGGAEKQLANLIAHRPDRAKHLAVHTITFLPPSSEHVRQKFEAAGATNTLIDRSSLPFPTFFLKLVRTLRSLRPVAVSTFLDSSVGAWGRLAALIAGVRVIVHSDRLLTPEGTRVHFWLRPFLDGRTARFLPNANAIADRLRDDGVPHEKIRVMPNGVDLAAFDPNAISSLRDEWGIPGDQVVLGYLGRFAPLKRIELLLEAVLQLSPNERPDALVLAGDGPTMPQIRQVVESDPWLRSRTKLLGSVDEPARFLASIDYLALPTEAEGLPNVVIEAMAMARPIVATRVSDIPWLVGDAGFLAEPLDPASIAAAIRNMQRLQPDERTELGKRARCRIEQEFAIDVAAARFWDAHLELLGDEAG